MKKPRGRSTRPEGDLRELGYERRAVDTIMRHCHTVLLPGYSRAVILVADYLDLLREHTYDGRARVRPPRRR